MNKKRLIDQYCKNYHLKNFDITYDMIMHHWNLERELAEKMHSCPEKDRTLFFKECYHKLYTSCPWLVTTGISLDNSNDWINWCINGSLSPNGQILELGGGAGNCAKIISEKGFFLTCIDLSDERVMQAKQESIENIQFLEGDATSLQFPRDTFNVVYSHQMIEHLHPDDVLRHFKEVYRVLKKGGFYYFTTPNGLWGPFDVSCLFGYQKARGMHLKEYSYKEMSAILKNSGFKELYSPIIHPLICKKMRISPPLVYIRRKCTLERILKVMPKFIKNFTGRIIVVKSIMIIARK